MRFCAVGLLVSLGAGVAAPVAAAGHADRAVERLGLHEIPQAVLDVALDDVRADTPEALAVALAEVLRVRLGEAAPPADVLLGALYGQLFRVLQEEVGDHAVLLAASAGGTLLAPFSGEVAPGSDAAPAPPAAALASSPQAPQPAPRALRPALQPLGP
ncbi:MAG: hypothetical protein R3181_03060 [Rubricoccaceae bacterium]|nr:hypothetical protein [Rubricoccaceae bacterium]